MQLLPAQLKYGSSYVRITAEYVLIIIAFATPYMLPHHRRDQGSYGLA